MLSAQFSAVFYVYGLFSGLSPNKKPLHAAGVLAFTLSTFYYQAIASFLWYTLT
jgi:hypothetical protein